MCGRVIEEKPVLPTPHTCRVINKYMLKWDVEEARKWGLYDSTAWRRLGKLLAPWELGHVSHKHLLSWSYSMDFNSDMC